MSLLYAIRMVNRVVYHLKQNNPILIEQILKYYLRSLYQHKENCTNTKNYTDKYVCMVKYVQNSKKNENRFSKKKKKLHYFAFKYWY